MMNRRIVAYVPLPILLLLAVPSTFAQSFWAFTGSLNHDRQHHTATLTPNGGVLIAGGVNNDGQTTFQPLAELYNPSTGTFSSAIGSMNHDRKFHTATSLQNGGVLIVGGQNNDSDSIHSSELYNPATGTFSNTGSLNHDRSDHTATLLQNGKVLVAGGRTCGGTIFYSCTTLSTAELYDPNTGTFSYTGSLQHDRAGQTATLLPSGQVLIAAGVNNDGQSINTAELYDPTTGTFSYTGNLLMALDSESTATLLQNGKVLIAGGWDTYTFQSGGYELYDSTTGTFSWSAGSGPGDFPFLQYATALLQNGMVLFAGGCPHSTCGLAQFGTTTAAWIYDPATDSHFSTASMPRDLARATATLLQNGQVVVAAGVNNDGSTINAAELFTY